MMLKIIMIQTGILQRIKYSFMLPILLLVIFNQQGICQNIQPKDVVAVETQVAKDSVKSAELLYINVILNIKDGWHINANKPLDDYLTPTSVTLKGNKNFKLLKIKYPPPLLMKLGFSENELALYVNQVNVELIVKALNPKDIKVGKIEGQVQYQPCNNQTCLFPVSKDFIIDLKDK